jgi:hypothetical protein
LAVYTSNQDDNKHFFRFLTCSSTEKYKKFIGYSNGLFVIENVDMSVGGLVKWGTPYRLKHLTTNKYLGIGSSDSFEGETDEKKENKSVGL